MDNCDKISNGEAVGLYRSTVKHSVLIVGIFLGIIMVFALYTAGIFFIGCWYGRRKSSPSLAHKMTMSPVTYTSVRGHQKPMFQYSERTEGCWSDWRRGPYLQFSPYDLINWESLF